MKLKTLLFFSILTSLTSCNGQTKNKSSNLAVFSKRIAQGDTVNKLGDHLWITRSAAVKLQRLQLLKLQ